MRGRPRDENPSPNALKLRALRARRRARGLCQFCPKKGTVGPDGGAPTCDSCRKKIRLREGG